MRIFSPSIFERLIKSLSLLSTGIVLLYSVANLDILIITKAELRFLGSDVLHICHVYIRSLFFILRIAPQHEQVFVVALNLFNTSIRELSNPDILDFIVPICGVLNKTQLTRIPCL